MKTTKPKKDVDKPYDIKFYDALAYLQKERKFTTLTGWKLRQAVLTGRLPHKRTPSLKLKGHIYFNQQDLNEFKMYA